MEPYEVLEQERIRFLRACVENTLEIGMYTFGTKVAVAKALGISKLHLALLIKEPEKMTSDVFFKLLQAFGFLDIYTNSFILYLKDLAAERESQDLASNTDYMNIERQMNNLKISFDPEGVSFKYPSVSLFGPTQQKVARQTHYYSFVASYEGAKERRIAIYRVVDAMKRIALEHNVTHRDVARNLPMTKMATYISIMRLYRPSGQGLESILPEVKPSDHDQLRTMANTLLATMQIVPVLVLAQQIEADYLNVG